MTTIDLDALEATARAATPGPWAIWHDEQGFKTFGGLSVWLSEVEATKLGQQLIEAGIRMRALAAKRSPI